jgi:hypothetical protein
VFLNDLLFHLNIKAEPITVLPFSQLSINSCNLKFEPKPGFNELQEEDDY